jgi:hypothetical protein
MEKVTILVRHFCTKTAFRFTTEHKIRTPEGVAKVLKGMTEPGYSHEVIVTSSVFFALGGSFASGEARIGATPVQVVTVGTEE